MSQHPPKNGSVSERFSTLFSRKSSKPLPCNHFRHRFFRPKIARFHCIGTWSLYTYTTACRRKRKCLWAILRRNLLSPSISITSNIIFRPDTPVSPPSEHTPSIRKPQNPAKNGSASERFLPLFLRNASKPLPLNHFRQHFFRPKIAGLSPFPGRATPRRSLQGPCGPPAEELPVVAPSPAARPSGYSDWGRVGQARSFRATGMLPAGERDPGACATSRSAPGLMPRAPQCPCFHDRLGEREDAETCSPARAGEHILRRRAGPKDGRHDHGWDTSPGSL